MKTRTVLLALLWSLLVCHPAGAQTTTTTYQLGLGSTDILDTYLSQEKISSLNKQWSDLGFHVISMKNDFKTIYGENVRKAQA